ncbi:MAG TPA: SRPBCC domain-containing protein [Longimicrobium sp.]|nr:SRPBCC domain-containing protein [Longimicrobium sp.]
MPTENTLTAHPAIDLQGQDLVLTRVFAAPRERVWQAWTSTEHFARWFGPHGTTLPFCTLDVRPGGVLHFRHQHANGDGVWVKGVYREVAAPERLVLDWGFSDADGNRVEHPGFAKSTRVTLTLAEEEGGTRVTIRHQGLGVDQGESQGWAETLERLAELLAAD